MSALEYLLDRRPDYDGMAQIEIEYFASFEGYNYQASS